jgi:hypothetical protein
MSVFTITSYAWRKQIADRLREAGHDAPDETEILASLTALARFLEDRALATRALLQDGTLVGQRDFSLRSSDVTEEGLAVIRASFPAWEKKGCPAADLGPLERALRKIRLKSARP